MIRLGPLGFLKSSNDSPKKYQLKIPSETKCIRKISSRILSALTPYGVDESKIFDIKLCIEEAVRNAIVHGNNSDRRRSVKVAYWVESDAINIEIEDEGPGFDHLKLADPTTGMHILKNSGRGVYLIKKLMDKVEYSPAGNKLTMAKRLR
jgi:serine/threonine-protein kinase RsbW